MLRRLSIPKKTIGPHKITNISDFPFLLGMTLAGSWSVVSNAHIQAFVFLLVLELSRSRSVARRARVQAFAQNLHTCWTPWSARRKTIAPNHKSAFKQLVRIKLRILRLDQDEKQFSLQLDFLWSFSPRWYARLPLNQTCKVFHFEVQDHSTDSVCPNPSHHSTNSQLPPKHPLLHLVSGMPLPWPSPRTSQINFSLRDSMSVPHRHVLRTCSTFLK